MGVGKAIAAVVALPLVLLVGLVVVLGDSEESSADEPRAYARTPGLCLSDNPAATSITAGSSVVSSSALAPAVPGTVLAEFGLNPDQSQIARTIVSVVKQRGLSLRAAEIALATGWVESNFRNLLVAVDHDSLGVFQQRPSVLAWGTAAEIVDVVHATTVFLDAMVRVDGWETSDPGWVAQKVQRSAFPNAYNDKGMPIAVPLAAALWTGSTAGSTSSSVRGCPATAPAGGGGNASGGGVQASGAAKLALERAESQLGLPYCWGGGDSNGPTMAFGGDGCNRPGFDCSGLMIYAWAGNGVDLPHRSAVQATMGTQVPMAQARPGDLVFWDGGSGVHHVAMIYSLTPGTTTGAGEIIEAQTFGVPVHIRPWRGTDEREVLHYAVRFAA